MKKFLRMENRRQCRLKYTDISEVRQQSYCAMKFKKNETKYYTESKLRDLGRKNGSSEQG